MQADRPHFAAGHMCTGCPLGDRLHTGCIVYGNVNIDENDPKRLVLQSQRTTQAEQPQRIIVFESTDLK